MPTPAAPIARDASTLDQIRADRAALERLAAASGLTVTACRELLRAYREPKNRLVSAAYNKQLARELRKVHIPARMGSG